MRYAIPVTENGATHLTQPVDIPSPLPDWANSPTSFLGKMFPNLSGFVQVADDNVSGAVLQGNGSYKNPDVPAPPVEPRIITRLQFKLRFTAPERIAIRASSDPIVFDFMDLLETAEDVDLGDPQLIAGVNYLEGVGLIAGGRAAAILGK